MTLAKQYRRALRTAERIEQNRFRVWELRELAEETGNTAEVLRLDRIDGRLWWYFCSADGEARALTPHELTCGARGVW